jgi:hypothetical protein
MGEYVNNAVGSRQKNPRRPTRLRQRCGWLTFAALCVFLARAASAHGPGGKTLDVGHRTEENAVGPIYYGEPLTQVSKTLGMAVPRRCALSPGCRAVRYTDGENLLILDYDESNKSVGWIRVFAHARSTDATKLPASVAPLAMWRWRGARILQLPPPRPISGWAMKRDADYTSFSYGHGCATAFDNAPERPRFMFYCE